MNILRSVIVDHGFRQAAVEAALQPEFSPPGWRFGVRVKGNQGVSRHASAIDHKEY
jgi:hypothetical protein